MFSGTIAWILGSIPKLNSFNHLQLNVLITLASSAGPLCLVVFQPETLYAQEAEIRTWHSAKGGFKIEAVLLDVRDGKVQLKKLDGTANWIEIQKLSLSDIRYVEETLREASNLGTNDQGESKLPLKQAPTSPVSVPPNMSTSSKSNQSMLDETLDESGGNEPDKLRNNVKTEFEGNEKPNQRFQNSFTGMRVSQYPIQLTSSSQLLLTARPTTFAAINQYPSVDILNLKTGKSLGTLPFSGSHFALSDDGTQTASVEGHPATIKVCETKTGRLRTEIKINSNQFVRKLYFSGPNELSAMISSPTELLRFDSTSGEFIDKIPLSLSSQKVEFSPSDDLIAFESTTTTLSVLNIKSGEILRTIGVPSTTGIDVYSIDDFSFSPDGTQIGILFNGREPSLYIYDIVNGQALCHHELKDKNNRIKMSKGQYSGPAITWTPGDRGWLIYGHSFVDKLLGGPLWSEKKDPGDYLMYRNFIDEKKVVSIVQRNSVTTVEVTDFPWDELQQSQTFVEGGGIAEDSNLPAIKPIQAPPGKLLVDNPKAGPFLGVKLEEKRKPIAAALPMDVNILGYGAHFSSQSAGRILLVKNSFMDSAGDSYIFDLNKPSAARSVNTAILRANHAISPNGKLVAGASSDSLSRIDIINLDSGKHVLGFRPPARNKTLPVTFTDIQWLANNLLAINDNSSTIDVWKVPSLEHQYSISSFGKIGLFPSGSKFAHYSAEGIKVRDVNSGKLLGLLEKHPSNSNFIPISLSISPDETKCLAVSLQGEGKSIAIWDLTTSKLIAEKSFNSLSIFHSQSNNSSTKIIFFDEFGRRMKADDRSSKINDINWSSHSSFLLITQTPSEPPSLRGMELTTAETACLYDWKADRVAWNYRTPVHIVSNSPAGQLWFQALSGTTVTLVGSSVPSPAVLSSIGKGAKAKSVLPEDSSVAIHVDAVLSREKISDGLVKMRIEDDIKKLLEKHKIKVVDRAPLKLSVNVVRRSAPIEFRTIRSSRGYGRSRGRGSDVIIAAGPPTTPLVLTAELTDISDNPLWSRSTILDLDESLDRESEERDAANPEDANAKSSNTPWEQIEIWLNQNLDPSKMYDATYFEGMGTSNLTQAGKENIRKR